MKTLIKYLSAVLLLCTVALATQSCGGEKPNRPDPVLTQDQINASQSQVQPPAVPSGQVATGGVKHYTCPNGHPEGGADTQGTCINCGATLVHNQAYHNQATPTTPANTTPPAPEPAQNAAGVWHYTCPNGHAGGGAGATPCGECGTTLVHNQAYH